MCGNIRALVPLPVARTCHSPTPPSTYLHLHPVLRHPEVVVQPAHVPLEGLALGATRGEDAEHVQGLLCWGGRLGWVAGGGACVRALISCAFVRALSHTSLSLSPHTCPYKNMRSLANTCLVYGPNVDVVGLLVLRVDVRQREVQPFLAEPLPGAPLVVGQQVLVMLIGVVCVGEGG